MVVKFIYPISQRDLSSPASWLLPVLGFIGSIHFEHSVMERGVVGVNWSLEAPGGKGD